MAVLTNRAGSGTVTSSTDTITLTVPAGLIVLIADEANGAPINIGCPLLWGDGVLYPAAPGEKVELNSPSTKVMDIVVNGTGSYRYRTISPEIDPKLRS